jgi:hypothetical protein
LSTRVGRLFDLSGGTRRFRIHGEGKGKGLDETNRRYDEKEEVVWVEEREINYFDAKMRRERGGGGGSQWLLSHEQKCHGS